MPGNKEQGFSAPRGMRDFYPEDMVIRNRLFDSWRLSAGRFGFKPYDACVVESLELLKRKSGEEIVDQIYHFKDKSDRDLALRPEMTPTLARMVSARLGTLSLPLKWYTIAQCFRYERTTRGRKREHYQWNLDILGEQSVSAEAEILATAVSALEQLEISGELLRIHFNSRALLSDLLKTVGIPVQNHQAVFLALDKRGKIPDEAINGLLHKAGLDDAGIAQAWRMLDMHTMDDVRQAVPESPALAQLDEFLQVCKAYGFEDRMVFDMSVIRGLAYYTGIVFEAFDIKREFRAVFGGGRYDNLLTEIGGQQLTGVGLGFGDVVIAEIINAYLPDDGECRPECDTAIGYMEEQQRTAAINLAQKLRSQGIDADMALAPEKPKKFFTRTGRGGYRQAVYLGPDDIERGSARIKNLTTREETEITLG